MEGCAESMTQTPNGTKIKPQLFVKYNYTNLLQHLNFWRPLTGEYSKGVTALYQPNSVAIN